MKIPELLGVTPCQTVNSYQHKLNRSASIFRVKKFQKSASHYLTLRTDAPHTFETQVFNSQQDIWIFKSFHIHNSITNSILYSWIVCMTSKASVYENVWFEQNRIILIEDIPLCLKYIKNKLNMYFLYILAWWWPFQAETSSQYGIIRKINIQLCQKEYILNLT
jgi:hypothetical protein